MKFIDAGSDGGIRLNNRELNRRDQSYEDDSDYEIDDIYSRKQLVKTKQNSIR